MGEPEHLHDAAAADGAVEAVDVAAEIAAKGEESLDDIESVLTSAVATSLGKKPQSLSPARDALIKKGLVYSAERGQIAFTVPHFGRYLRTVTAD